MARLPQDLQYGIRSFAKAPGFTVMAVTVMALGIGANAAIFTIVNELMFRPLSGYADDLVGVYSHDRTVPDSHRAFSYPNYVDIRERADLFEGLMAHTYAMVGTPAGDTTRRMFADVVSSNYFDTLGVGLAIGRPFTADEERPGARIPVVIASYPWWKKANLDPAFIGRTITINSRDFTVVGVTPEGFTGTMALVSAEVYLPLGMFDDVVNDLFKNKGTGLADRANEALVLAGRLKPGVSEAAVTARLDTLSRQLEAAYPGENRNQALTVSPLPRMSTSTSPRTDTGLGAFAGLLLGLSGVVLVIACLNVANMLLARGGARRKELALRLALGAHRGRVVRQLLTESLAHLALVLRQGLFLTGAGIALGLPLAVIVSSAFTKVFVQVGGFDAQVVSFATVVLSLSSMAASAIPARRAAKVVPLRALRTE